MIWLDLQDWMVGKWWNMFKTKIQKAAGSIAVSTINARSAQGLLRHPGHRGHILVSAAGITTNQANCRKSLWVWASMGHGLRCLKPLFSKQTLLGYSMTWSQSIGLGISLGRWMAVKLLGGCSGEIRGGWSCHFVGARDWSGQRFGGPCVVSANEDGVPETHCFHWHRLHMASFHSVPSRCDFSLGFHLHYYHHHRYYD